MTSDSSDEENLDLLKEAQDPQFINDSMFTDSPAKRTESANKKPLPSLRRTTDKDEQFNYFIKVTPEFRNYVSKQLSKILDRKLEKKFADLETPEAPRKKRKKTGIKLLSESEQYLEIDVDHAVEENRTVTAHNATAKRLKNKKNHKSNGEITEEEFRKLAVSGQVVLRKKEVKHWSKRSKAAVFHYKNKNGTLELVEPKTY
ncbi:hypothetical protein NQ315_002916 [Exocentrus adspersus]|uniref:Protein CUSTOS n=1 Tax=Exocentrus adspersus TaxID=1586481 RepID=A0AAV8V650_9CUCU|nr:hypothetical protein NQ315_002916 [Exocentrus adspersus]